jgi:hypothetical protein
MPLGPLTVCAAHLLALPIFQRFQLRSATDEIMRRFCSSVEALQKLPAAPRLDSFLADRLDEAERHLKTLAEPEQSALRVHLANLRAALSPQLCDSCRNLPGSAGHICDGRGRQKDQEQVTSAGLCLSLLREMHDQIVPRLERLVGEWGFPSQPGIVSSLAHAWGTGWPGHPKRDTPGTEPKVGASTEFFDTPTGRHAEVRVELAADDLDWPSLLMVPWLFAHEYVCHVLQLPIRASAPRGTCRRACPFFEGWMDEVALQLFESQVVPSLNAKQWPLVSNHRKALIEAAYQHHIWRYDLAPGAARKPEAPEWWLGVEAARVVLEFFQLASSPIGPLRQLVALSFNIQRAAPLPAELDRAVDGCLVAARTALTGDDQVRARVLALFSGPIGNMSKWLRELESL